MRFTVWRKPAKVLTRAPAPYVYAWAKKIFPSSAQNCGFRIWAGRRAMRIAAQTKRVTHRGVRVRAALKRARLPGAEYETGGDIGGCVALLCATRESCPSTVDRSWLIFPLEF
jgi:hypothetical protein